MVFSMTAQRRWPRKGQGAFKPVAQGRNGNALMRVTVAQREKLATLGALWVRQRIDKD